MHIPEGPAVLLHVGAYAPATSGHTAAVMQVVPKSRGGGFGFQNGSVNAIAQAFCSTANVTFKTYAACVAMIDVLCIHTDIPYSDSGKQLSPVLPALKLLASDQRTSGLVQAGALYIEAGLNIIEEQRRVGGLDLDDFESVCWGDEAVRGIGFISAAGLQGVPKFMRLLRDVRGRKIAHPQVLSVPWCRLANVETATDADALLTPAACRMGGDACTAYYSKLKGDTPELKALYSEIAMQALSENGKVRSQPRLTPPVASPLADAVPRPPPRRASP